jgi:uncharacterized protein YciI
MLYILYCRDDPGSSARIRAELIDDHKEYLQANRQIILLGGAMLAEDGSTRVGSAIILSVPNRAEAVKFSEHEPFRKAGLYGSVDICRVRRGQWYPENVPRTVDGD